MRLAAVLIPPSLDAKQALRLRRMGFAALSYALATALTALLWAFGLLAASVALEVAATFLVLNLALYAFMRSGLNLRFKDPSLTAFQILTAITVVMYIVYHMDEGRQGVLFACFIVFLFGIFRFNAREFTLVTLYTLAAYALVIGLLMQWRPLAIHDVRLEWISWLTLAGFLPCFAIIGGHINTLRRRLHESEMRFRKLSEMSSDFYWESDTEHRLRQRSWVDKTLCSRSVFGRGSPIGNRRWELPYLSPDEAGWLAHRTLLEARRAFRDFEFSRLAADGSERHISISGDPVFNASGAFQGYRGVGSDITERKHMEEQIRQLAFYDPLTELPNRRLLLNRMSHALAESKRSGRYGALMFLDLDNFKALNDTAGHAVGDLLLMQAAKRMKSCVREVDTVARFGGDEFVVMVSDLDADKAASTTQANNIAEKIRAALAAPYLLTVKHDGGADSTVEHQCSASIGAVVFIDREGSQDDFLKWADAAMYMAKEAGGNLIRFHAGNASVSA